VLKIRIETPTLLHANGLEMKNLAFMGARII
jgi:hypothetical protein